MAGSRVVTMSDRALADFHIALARNQARRGLHRLAEARYRMAAAAYLRCGCDVFAAWAEDEADAEAAECRPSARPNTSGLVD